MADLLGDARFVRLITVSSLPLARSLQKHLRGHEVAAVILNDEAHQARPDEDPRDFVSPEEGLRIEVPETVYEKARDLMDDFFERLDAGGESDDPA